MGNMGQHTLRACPGGAKQLRPKQRLKVQNCAPRAQVERWNREALMEFWGDWYFPANATLYIVGQLDRSVPETVELIGRTFGSVPPGRERPQTLEGPASQAGQATNGAPAHGVSGGGGGVVAGGAGLAPAAGAAGAASGNGAGAPAHAAAEVLPPLKRRHQVRPPETWVTCKPLWER